jgi:ABC-type nitrate/sulfonate/bicarbonate transport system substrate-binding protein
MIVRRRHVLVGAAFLAMAGQGRAEALREISMGLSSTSLGTAGPRIAKEIGLFAKHGIDPRFVILDSANAALGALVSGSLPVVLAGPTELIAAQARGQKVVAIATTYRGLGQNLVLAKAVADRLGVLPTAPVAARLKAVDGLLIGAPSATSIATIALKGATRAEGATVRLTYMDQPAMVAGLQSGAIQGFIASAPFWAFPVTKGTGVLWINGPKGEFPPEYTPANTGHLEVMRSFAEANPELVRSIAAVMAEFVKALDERPAEVRAAVAKLYPDLDAGTLDLLIASESLGWRAKPPTADDLVHDVAFLKAGGVALPPQVDTLDPASLVWR